MTDFEAQLQREIYILTNELKKTTNKYQQLKLATYIESIKNIINVENLDVKFPKEMEYEITKYYNHDIFCKIIDEYYYNVEKNYSYNKRFVKMLNHFNKRYIISDNSIVFNNYLEFKDVLFLVSDFLKYYDKKIYNHFVKLFNEDRIMAVSICEDAEGFCIPQNFLIDSYISYNQKNYILDVSTLCHEIIHSYVKEHVRYNNYKNFKYEFINNMDEVYSLFIELALFDYLEKIKFDANDIYLARKANDIEVISELELFKKSLNNFSTISAGEYKMNEANSYGHVLAYHFYDNYLNDKERAKSNIFDFMIDCESKNRDYLFNNYGLNQEYILNPQRLTKYMDKSLRRVK